MKQITCILGKSDVIIILILIYIIINTVGIKLMSKALPFH